jgi:hypothetical protein
MFDLGGFILSFIERIMTPPQNQGPKAKLSPPELAYKVAFCFIVAWLVQFLIGGMFNLTNHPLADFSGPSSAAFTEWYKTYRELFCGESWVHVLEELHQKYGRFELQNVTAQTDSRKEKSSESALTRCVMIIPTLGKLCRMPEVAAIIIRDILTCIQISFSDPAAYYEIYNGTNRWDKDPKLYQSFGEDHSTFGCLKYADAKKRKDILGPMFSRKAISDLQSLVQGNVFIPVELWGFEINFSG